MKGREIPIKGNQLDPQAVHKKLNPKDFHANGKVLSDPDIKLLEKMCDNNQLGNVSGTCRYTKSFLAQKFNIHLKKKSGKPHGGVIVSRNAVGEKEIFIVCQGATTGAGAFGKYKIVQSMKTGKLYAIKVLKKIDSTNEQEAKTEATHMKNLGRGSDEIFYKKTMVRRANGTYAETNSTKRYFMAELIPGNDLDEVLKNELLIAEDRLEIALQACEKTHADLAPKKRTLS